ncbi:MAG: D-tyrosyl-tRNA(Tyr) deacylase [Nitrososphaeria archaeon]|nr:D-tyrosyl-tRNA(Tyr) deacylase [Nitrosopumilaceae archaeon]NIP10369.1 D-tyrosyl-tRNA(Tyr) deacylase [Nitrosopumilaceae archaeon]NIP91096.1 D-tyrosyl-tRNA(Tyr) deacylase [Nitrososphaeria archaeon]NIS95048.1 D-tyrosyl-tRNA(Tyr) deacylase [Nitrosopumilaceae archaeon]
MELLVAYKDDPAGNNMATYLSQNMKKDGDIFRGENYDLLIIPTPAIKADWLEEKYDYDGYIFLSKHAAESGVLALTCHSTGNFSEAKFGGNYQQMAVPHPDIQKKYLQKLWENRSQFSEFQITIEATHHGPTALSKPAIFIEIGTTEKQWTDVSLCNSIAKIVDQILSEKIPSNPVAICFGGTHYPEKFTKELLEGKHALGTVMPKHALDNLDEKLFSHILERNKNASAVLLDWAGLGQNKTKVMELVETTNLEVVKL